MSEQAEYLLKQQAVRVTFDLPVSLDELLSLRVSKREAGKKISKRRIFVRALLFYLASDLDWKDSKRQATMVLSLLKDLNDPKNNIEVEMDKLAVIKLHDQIHEKFEKLGIPLGKETPHNEK